jgi:molybdopterin-guanine dinucleotide biosynthesis protein A
MIFPFIRKFIHNCIKRINGERVTIVAKNRNHFREINYKNDLRELIAKEIKKNSRSKRIKV